jgi:EAL domain-containing protein (putative c-di-GMP-specific phosphodiesterase class I)
LSGFESLIRWNHPKRGMVSPVEFIPVSEETGMIVPITLWMLRESCRQLVNWQRKFPQMRKVFVSVNLSSKHFTTENIFQQVGQILLESEMDPSCLKLEITESAMMENPEEVVNTLVRLKSLGIQLSIDDFGTGYSSLSYLHRFPVDTLKVDRSFVIAMDKGSENGEIIKTIVSMAQTLRMKVIAEGIETIDHLHKLRILGCNYGQGYLLSRPVPANDAEKFLADESHWRRMFPPSNQIIPPQPAADESWRLRLAK